MKTSCSPPIVKSLALQDSSNFINIDASFYQVIEYIYIYIFYLYFIKWEAYLIELRLHHVYRPLKVRPNVALSRVIGWKAYGDFPFLFGISGFPPKVAHKVAVLRGLWLILLLTNSLPGSESLWASFYCRLNVLKFEFCVSTSHVLTLNAVMPSG